MGRKFLMTEKQFSKLKDMFSAETSKSQLLSQEIVDQASGLFNRYDAESTGLPLDIWIDSDCNYQHLGIPMCVLVRNGATLEDHPIAISISNNPEVISIATLAVPDSSIASIFGFIQMHIEDLVAAANGQLDDYEFIRSTRKRYSIAEGKEIISEMSILSPAQTGLKLKIWIDDSLRWKQTGHYARMKFENPYDNKEKSAWGSILFPSLSVDKKCTPQVSYKYIKQIIAYITENKQLFAKMVFGDIDVATFLASSIKVDEKGRPINKETENTDND